MSKFNSYATSKMGNFIWDGFTNPTGVGVDVATILDGASLAGLHLTEAQKDGVLSHMDDVDGWTSEDEDVRDAIADATDNATYEQLFAWLAFVVGDNTAADLVKEWEDEAQENAC